jgi:hypothetical protein
MIALPNPTKILYTEHSSDNTMTATFTDYVAQKDAQNTIQLNVTKYCFMLCDALLKNYIDYSIKSHNNVTFHGQGMPSLDNYHLACIEDLKAGNCGYEFTIQSGRKYHKIMMSANGSQSVHAFVDKKTGEVYKPASIKAPAKGVRFNLLIIQEREFVLENCDWSGGYLYKNAYYQGA